MCIKTLTFSITGYNVGDEPFNLVQQFGYFEVHINEHSKNQYLQQVVIETPIPSCPDKSDVYVNRSINLIGNHKW